MQVAAVILVFLTIAGVVILAAILAERQRQKKIEETAESLGLSYNKADDPGLRERLGRISLLQTGHSRASSNCLSGDSGEVRISIFDYTYTTGSGKHKHTRRLTLAALESSRLKIPEFSLRPESIFDRLGGVLGFNDIDFEDDPEFSSAVYLKGANEGAIRELFNRELRAWFVRNPGFSAEASAGQLVCFLGRNRARPEDYPDLLKKTYEVFGLIVDRD